MFAPAGSSDPACVRYLWSGPCRGGGNDQPLPSALGAERCCQSTWPGTPKVRELVNQLPHAFWVQFERTADGRPASPFAALHASHPGPSYQAIFDDAEAILQLPRHVSMHPGGVIVAPGSLTDLVPVMRSGGKGTIITQLDLDSVEALGLVKIDLLGIRGLTVLGDVAEFIQTNEPDAYLNPLAVLELTPPDDPATAQRVETGGMIGCFQIESSGYARHTARDPRP